MKPWDSAWFDAPGAMAQRSMAAWRCVEAQHVVSTNRLVDTAHEQDLLEHLLETSKPALPRGARATHYLLVTPFRYRPEHASRFRPARAGGQWYGAQNVYGACAEVAYWRHRFLMDSAGLQNHTVVTEHSIFQAQVDGLSIDLMAPPWVQARALWTHSDDYHHTHAVAAQAQQRGVAWLGYESVRAPGQRCAVAFTPDCLHEPAPSLDATTQRWVCKTTRAAVYFTGKGESWAWDF